MEFTLNEDGLLEVSAFNSESRMPLESKQMSIRKDRGEEVNNIIHQARIRLREGETMDAPSDDEIDTWSLKVLINSKNQSDDQK